MNEDEVRLYMRIGIPTAIMYCVEYWAYDIIVLIATLISVGAVSAMTISANYFSLVSMFAYGF